MCIGIPMIVKELPDEGVAICEGRGLREKIDIMMVGPLEPGTWILAWNGTAMDVLTEVRAAQVSKALDSLENVMNGNLDPNTEDAFADITANTGRLPPHLAAQLKKR